MLVKRDRFVNAKYLIHLRRRESECECSANSGTDVCTLDNEGVHIVTADYWIEVLGSVGEYQ